MSRLCWASLITGEQRAPVWASKWHHMFSQTNWLSKCHLPIQDALSCVSGNQSLTLIKPFTPEPPPYKIQLSVIFPAHPPVHPHSFLRSLTIYYFYCGLECAATSFEDETALVNQK